MHGGSKCFELTQLLLWAVYCELRLTREFNGMKIQSECGATTARISVENGFNLFSIMVDTIELLWHDERFLSGEASASGSGTPILFPIPGRLNGQIYNYAGREYRIDSDDGNGNAIHGFVLNRPWRVLEQNGNTIIGEFQASVDDPELLSQWPSDFTIRCRYKAVADGVEAYYEIENPGQDDLPCGLGTHAYFRMPLGGKAAEECVVTCPISEHWPLENMLATGEVNPIDETQPFDSGITFGSLFLDDVFSGISFESGRATAGIFDPQSSKRLVYTWDEACEFCVMYTPPHRQAICMEPYTLVPGGLAFDSGDHGLIVLKAGESFTHNMEIRLQ